MNQSRAAGGCAGTDIRRIHEPHPDAIEHQLAGNRAAVDAGAKDEHWLQASCHEFPLKSGESARQRAGSPQANLFLAFQRALQVQYVCSHALQVRIQLQRPAKALQGRRTIAELQMAMCHARGGAEMIGVDFQGLIAITDGFGIAANIEQG